MKKIVLIVMFTILTIGFVSAQSWEVGGTMNLNAFSDYTDVRGDLWLSHHFTDNWFYTVGMGVEYENEFTSLLPYLSIGYAFAQLGPTYLSTSLGAFYDYHFSDEVNFGFFITLDASFVITERWMFHVGLSNITFSIYDGEWYSNLTVFPFFPSFGVSFLF